ncbi:MAG: M48 family metallopeptidase [Cyclobacteriaceae bacterium]|nr:M48 family metallopeptidase [Cyclobacteriaceae bacterium]
MTSDWILNLLLILVSSSFLLGELLEWLNLRHMRTELPEEVAGFYDAEKYRKSQEYHRELNRFGLLQSLFSFIVLLIMLLTGGFGWLDNVLRQYTTHPVLLPLVFFAVLGLASELLSLPFQWYGTFVIEEKYGFNRTTVKTFITDKLKGYVLGALIGGGLLTVLLYLINRLGPDFWIWFLLVAAAFMLMMNIFYTSWILPLFNRLTPLPDGELKTKIENLAQKVGFPVKNILVMDGSKRSSKANAFFSGLGKKKKIVLFDTLIDKHTVDELVAVLAHEIGHYKKRHIVLGYAVSVLQMAFVLFVLSRMVFSVELSYALGGSTYAVHLNLIAFVILFSPISALTGVALNALSRKHEYEADAFAAQTADAQALATALKKLSVDNLSNLYPHPLYVWAHYSHPPLLNRLQRLK